MNGVKLNKVILDALCEGPAAFDEILGRAAQVFQRNEAYVKPYLSEALDILRDYHITEMQDGFIYLAGDGGDGPDEGFDEEVKHTESASSIDYSELDDEENGFEARKRKAEKGLKPKVILDVPKKARAKVGFCEAPSPSTVKKAKRNPSGARKKSGSLKSSKKLNETYSLLHDKIEASVVPKLPGNKKLYNVLENGKTKQGPMTNGKEKKSLKSMKKAKAAEKKAKAYPNILKESSGSSTFASMEGNKFSVMFKSCCSMSFRNPHCFNYY